MEKEIYTPTQLGLQFEDIYLDTSDSTKIHGWRLPSKEQRKGTIIFFHGNAENISTHIASVFWLPSRNYEVYIFDYRGYGRSQGEPSIEGVMIDAQSIIDYVTKTLDRKNVVVLGQSLGCAIALNAVSRAKHNNFIKAVVVDSCFSGFRKIAREKLSELWITWPLQYPLSYAFSASFSPISAIASIKSTPVLLIHGNQDSIIPIHHSVALFEAANNPKEFWAIDGGTHIDSMARTGIRNQLDDYLISVFENNIPSDSKNHFKLDMPK